MVRCQSAFRGRWCAVPFCSATAGIAQKEPLALNLGRLEGTEIAEIAIDGSRFTNEFPGNSLSVIILKGGEWTFGQAVDLRAD
jgi:hypothetical protein